MAASDSTTITSSIGRAWKSIAAPNDGEVEPQQQIDRDLGRRGRQEGRHPGWRIGVGVGQPDVEREERELEAYAHGDEGQPGHDRRANVRPGRPQARRHVGHVERAGHEIEQADADHVEGRADRAHDQVLERRQQRAPVAPQRDQHVGRQRRDLQEDEGVERVAGHRDAEQAGEAQQVHAVEPRLAVLADLEGDGQPRERHGHRADARSPARARRRSARRRGTRCPRAAPSRRDGRRSAPSCRTCQSRAPAISGDDPAHGQRRARRPAARAAQQVRPAALREGE